MDFQLAFAKSDIRKPCLGFQSQLDYDPRETCDCVYVHRAEADSRHEKTTFHDLDFDLRENRRYLENRWSLLALMSDAKKLRWADRLLLPCTVHGFVLRSRKWRTFRIDRVEDVKYSRGFDDLVLPSGHRKTVEALVNSHARQSLKARNKRRTRVSVDLVAGKGKGLIILLHGAPGVGKTSTAECVADKTERR